MLYSNVYIDTICYELAQNVVTSSDIEEKLAPLYEKLHFKTGQLEALTGIKERRFWDKDVLMYDKAVKAGKKAITQSNIPVESIGMLIYAGVCRDNIEPATACATACGLNISSDAEILDVSNACLGVLNGIIIVANAIELGQIEAGIVTSCESAREIIDITIKRMLVSNDMDMFKKTVATLTGGSGACAVVLSNGSFNKQKKQSHKLLGGAVKNASEHNNLCWWGPDTKSPASGLNIMETDSVNVLKNGVKIGMETFDKFKKELNLSTDEIDKTICHQVGSAHQKTILSSLAINFEKDYSTYQYLGNIGTVSLPLTAAIAADRGFIKPGDLVGLLGIGSGLNCLMLGVKW